MFIIISVLI